MGLRFGDLTPEEFTQIVTGYRQREERDWFRTAWMVAYLLAPWSKRKLTPEKLLGRRVTAHMTHKPATAEPEAD